MKTFKTELNYEQVDIINHNDINDHIYHNIKIEWGLHLLESQVELEIRPFIDRIQVWTGEDVRKSDKMLIVKNDFLDIINDESTEFRVNTTIIRDNPYSESASLIVPKFIGIDMKNKKVEVLFNA